MLDHLLARKIFGLVVERPAEQHQVVDDRVGQVADLAIEIDDDRIERLGSRNVSDASGDLRAVIVEPLELRVFQVLGDLSLGELLRAARLGDVGQRLSDENLARRVRKVLDRANHMRDPKIVVIDHACQVIQARSVGPLHDVVLLLVPIELANAANRVGEDAFAFPGDLQPHDLRSLFGFEFRRLLIGLGHPAAAVEKSLFLLFRRFALGFQLVGSREVAIRQSFFQ